MRCSMNITKININLIGHDSIVSIELPYLLSEIEVSLLYQLLQGYSVNEISQKRNRSIKTVSCQKIKLYKKLGVKSDLTLWRDVFFMFKVSIQAKNITCNKLNNSLSSVSLTKRERSLLANLISVLLLTISAGFVVIFVVCLYVIAFL